MPGLDFRKVSIFTFPAQPSIHQHRVRLHPLHSYLEPVLPLPSMPFLSDPQPRILIAGTGIGGLSAALALYAAGFTNIYVFEASATLTTLGMGINVQPSAVLILCNLGLLPALRDIALETRKLNFYSRYGNPILLEPRGVGVGYKVP